MAKKANITLPAPPKSMSERMEELKKKYPKEMAEYEELLLLSECHSRSRRYPAIKRWFLEMYPEVVSYGSAEERPKILQIGEKRAS